MKPQPETTSLATTTDHVSDCVMALRNLVAQATSDRVLDQEMIGWLREDVNELASCYVTARKSFRGHSADYNRANSGPVDVFGIPAVGYHSGVLSLISAVLFGIWNAIEPDGDGEDEPVSTDWSKMPVQGITAQNAGAVAVAATLDTPSARSEQWGPLEPRSVERLVAALTLERDRAADVNRYSESMTLQQIGKIFTVHRNHVHRDVLSRYAHQQVAQKYRLRIVDLPLNYAELAGLRN